ncbi:hypothetical protein DFH08DRAFT_810353 [Mycena albidolilacea]|uniref:Mitochondrial carrier n=1 Tax=Mycena albidolilacea TaxID=1033008 RepID=A0AAD6ZXW3_9AGAR|nr:hypothetical protein DFH08DRAFT_810353 [Mycena albidolilacea]
MHDIIVALLFILLGIPVDLLSFCFLFGITIPFAGVLVRYRANYTPKAAAVRLDDEPGVPSTLTSDASLSYFGMMKRVYHIEGLGGFYKGLVPSIVSTVAMVGITISVIHAIFQIMPNNDGPLDPLWSFARSVLVALLLVPAEIIINRAITTSHKLTIFHARKALHLLLSPAERAQPLRLYLAPGVAFASLLQGLVFPALSVLRQVAEHSLPPGAFLGGALPFMLLAVGILTPLKVMTARLTLQRRGPETLEPLASDAPSVYAERVMHFRTEEAPYTSLLDCGRKMVAEEGWSVLARTWWLTALGMARWFGTPALLRWIER